MITAAQIQRIADECMKQMCVLSSIADKHERGSEVQQELYACKNVLWNAVSGLWPIAAQLRINEQAQEEQDGQRPE